VVEIYDRIPMHAQKTVWVKHGLEVLHTLAKQVRSFPNVEPNVLSQRLHPLDIFDPYEHNLLTRLHCQSP
jgi:hypothetical protein